GSLVQSHIGREIGDSYSYYFGTDESLRRNMPNRNDEGYYRISASAPERITRDTHLFVVPFGTADPRQYYPNYLRPAGASSSSQSLPPRRYEDLPLQAIHRARFLSAGHTPSPSPTSTSP
ncbi:hypothetical protein MTR67_052683, partial [Solanum verrucosum]